MNDDLLLVVDQASDSEAAGVPVWRVGSEVGGKARLGCVVAMVLSLAVGSVGAQAAAGEDLIPPTIVRAQRLLNLTNIVVTFSEAMDATALDRLRYLVCIGDEWVECLGVLPTSADGRSLVFMSEEAVQVLLATTPPADPNAGYRVGAMGVQDLAGNGAEAYLSAPVTPMGEAVFRRGLYGELEVVDTWIEADNVDAAHGSDTVLWVDNAGPVSQGLLWFEGIMGPGVLQVPYASWVYVAELSLYTSDPGAAIQLHRMLMPWEESATWASLGGGVMTNDIQARSTVDATFSPTKDEQPVRVDVTAAVQAWVDGEANHGWVLVNTGEGFGGGWEGASAEHSVEARRPTLRVQYSAANDVPVVILGGPSSSTVYVGPYEDLELTFVVGGSRPWLQWFKDDLPLANQTNATLRMARVTWRDSGSYYLQATNSVPSATNSPVIQVHVHRPHPPWLVSALASGRTNLTTVAVQFSEPLNPTSAVDIVNYTLSPPVAIEGATLMTSSRVWLQVAAPFGCRYVLRVTGVEDPSGGRIEPPGSSLEVTSILTVADWDAAWRYDTNNLDLITAAPPFWDPAFDDAPWLSGAGPLGSEVGSTEGAFGLGTAVSAPGWTTYYRSWFEWPYRPEALDPGVRFEVRHAVDDGVVLHVNGAEAFRHNVAAGPAPLAHASFATASIEAVLVTNALPAARVVLGSNCLAAQLHAASLFSSDNLFGAQVLAVLEARSPVGFILVPPTNRMLIGAGDPFVLEFGVSGSMPRFQWFHDSEPIAGATSAWCRVGFATSADAGDYFLRVTNDFPSGTNSPVIRVEVLVESPSLCFRQGHDGYFGTVDTYVAMNNPDAAYGSSVQVWADGENPVRHGLLRFDGIFGSDAGQVPVGCYIERARLSLLTTNSGDWVSVHRMLSPWSEMSTWNSLGSNGVVGDGIIAAPAREFEFWPALQGETLQLDVTASVQAWATGAVNAGWAFLPQGSDGYAFCSSETPDANARPTLEVVWRDGPDCLPLQVWMDLPSSAVLLEGESLTLEFLTFGSRPAYQWFADGQVLRDATGSELVVDFAGSCEVEREYLCIAANGCSAVTSTVARVVRADLPEPLALLSAAADGTSLQAVLLTFDARLAVAEAEVAGHYSLVAGDGTAVGVQAAELLSARTVRLTLAQGLEFGVPYHVMVGPGVVTWSQCPRPAAPPGNHAGVIMELPLLGWSAAWRLDPDRLADDNYDGVPWFEPGFDDSTWQMASGPFGVEHNPTVLDSLPAPILSAVPTNRTVYFRATFVSPLGELPAGGRLVVSHLVDDGMSFYFNGSEVFRHRLPDGPIGFTNWGYAGEAVLTRTNLPGSLVVSGVNQVACTLHAAGEFSSDSLFALEVRAQFDPAQAPHVYVVRRVSMAGGQRLQFAWDGFGVLEQAGDPAGPYTVVPGALNGGDVETVGPQRFFRVRVW